MNNWDKNWASTTRSFILSEAAATPQIDSLIQNIENILSSLSPKSKREQRDVDVARHCLNQIRKQYRHELSELSTIREELNDIREIQDV